MGEAAATRGQNTVVISRCWRQWKDGFCVNCCVSVYSGSGWASLEVSCAQTLLSRTAEGEFWMNEAEFLQEFDEVTVGCPVSDAGHLQSIYTGTVLSISEVNKMLNAKC